MERLYKPLPSCDELLSYVVDRAVMNQAASLAARVTSHDFGGDIR
jgi:hypothetical protein